MYCNDAFCQPVLCRGIHVPSSSNTDFVNNSIIHILSYNMERYCLDAQCASGALPREAVYCPNYEREMGSFGFGVGHENPAV